MCSNTHQHKLSNFIPLHGIKKGKKPNTSQINRRCEASGRLTQTIQSRLRLFDPFREFQPLAHPDALLIVAAGLGGLPQHSRDVAEVAQGDRARLVALVRPSFALDVHGVVVGVGCPVEGGFEEEFSTGRLL